MGLPENIDALLVKYDINQEQLARVAEVHPSSVARWRQDSQMRRSSLERICEYFDLVEDDLLSTENGLAAKEHGYVPETGLSDDEMRLVNCFRALDNQGQKLVLDLVENLASRE